MRSRYYAPELMRFVQKDQHFSGTLDDPQSLNRYAYVKGDPIRFVDPNGDSWSFWDIVTLVGTVVGLAIGVAFLVLTGPGGWALLGTVVGIALSIGAGAIQIGLEETEKHAEERATAAEKAIVRAKTAWSLEDLRRQLEDPNASWNRGLSVPLARSAPADAAARPAPCH